eukprot:5074511-Pyramimonas_sp.AAC.4
MNNLALLLKKRERYQEAVDLFENCLELRQEALGEKHPDVAMVMNNLAGVHSELGARTFVTPF